MKGLLLKDYYLIRSVLYIILVVFAVVGIGNRYQSASRTAAEPITYKASSCCYRLCFVL